MLIGGRYRPSGQAGRGGEGEVLRCRDARTDRTVAIKRLAAEPSVREAAADLVSLGAHPNLSMAHEAFEEEGSLHLVMEWADGSSLTDVVAAEGPLSLDRALPIARDIGAALEHLHAAGISHGDVKPANVVVGTRVVLVDLPLGRRDGMGSGIYRPPEVAAGGAPSPASDVYGLAATIVTMLTGDVPREGRVPDLIAVPEAVRSGVLAALRRGMHPNPSLRPRAPGLLVDAVQPPAHASNLPARATSFFGREREIARMSDGVERTRWVTLLGPAGVGKTALAIEGARRLNARFEEGVWLVELADADGPAIADDIARALGVGRSGLDHLIGDLASRRILVVLDNCEHVHEAARAVCEAILASCAGVSIVTTSRRPLEGAGEWVMQVPPLPRPDPREATTEGIKAYPAVRLFLDRAFGSGGPQPEEHTLRRIAEACDRLEGIPLAIELAAASVQAGLPVDDLDEGAGGDIERALDAALSRSVQLLPEEGKKVFAELSVFRGGFRRSSVEPVCTAPGATELLDGLVTLSLVQELYPPPEARYRMLEIVRARANAMLQRGSTANDVRRRFDEHLLELIFDFDPADERVENQGPWLDRIEEERDNVRTLLEATAARDPADHLRVLHQLVPFFTRKGHLDEALGWLVPALERVHDTGDVLYIKAAHHVGNLLHRAGRAEEGRRWLASALEAARASELPRMIVPILGSLATVHLALREPARALEALDEWDRLAPVETPELDRDYRTRHLYYRGWAAHLGGDLQTAEVRYRDALAAARDEANLADQTAILNNLAQLVGENGDSEEAYRCYLEALEAIRALGHRDLLHLRTLSNLGSVAGVLGLREEAWGWYSLALEMARDTGHRSNEIAAQLGLGRLRWKDDAHEALELCEHGLRLALELGDRYWIGIARLDVGKSLHRLGRMDDARAAVTESLRASIANGATKWASHAAETLAALAMDEANGSAAAAALGAALALRARAGIHTRSGSVADRLEDLRDRFGAGALADAERWARAELDDALTAALGEADAARAVASADPVS